MHDEIVDRMARGLLELDAYDAATVSEFACLIANEKMGEVLPSARRSYRRHRSRSAAIQPFYYSRSLWAGSSMPD